jgi:hypothetical protein
LIYETVITTANEDGSTHIAPMGVIERDACIMIQPFLPSTTQMNIERSGEAVINHTDNVEIIAGCLTGRTNWPLVPSERVSVQRLRDCLAHRELRVAAKEEDPVRPRYLCEVVHNGHHGDFKGFNRAQAAVIEAAILVSRLNMLPEAKIRAEIDYLRIAIDKTAGPRERRAWQWLMEKIAAFQERQVAEK